ncbi:transcriptional regulator, AraC family [Desulfarculus baarsii DSM 2075]|uniref:Transcriptional regulator, AraC family n=1 Tax=Desulfarculus baarsii (strain ATCC 33931 / DSM 2075 / LMG 7858 / VKM B-1802 / 2st14) TaxID=644282 RepID=E1QGJ5_DESB2|nr:AraC family transcriptional regulator [Desulfarculus baarsii]ADK84688.1 transcriptional regulator, AraC family [Desulfarculus baarsii DSM 2075]
MKLIDQQQAMIDFYGQLRGQASPCFDRVLPVPRELGAGRLRALCPRRGMLLLLEDYQLTSDVRIANSNMPLPLGFSFCISGRVQWTISGVKKSFCTEAGQCELLFTSHTDGQARYEAGQPVRMINLMLSPALLQSYFDQPLAQAGAVCLAQPPTRDQEPIHRSGPFPGAIEGALRQLLRAPCRNAADGLLIQAKVMELVAFLLGLLGLADSQEQLRPSAADAALVERAKGILRARMHQPPTMDRLARMVGASPSKLKRCFAALCDVTVYGYLNHCRMERARELLADDGLTMAHIAAELGYAERTHFSRAFARHFGLPPSEYRLRLADGPPGQRP